MRAAEQEVLENERLIKRIEGNPDPRAKKGLKEVQRRLDASRRRAAQFADDSRAAWGESLGDSLELVHEGGKEVWEKLPWWLCSDTEPGQRLVVGAGGADYYTEPCSQYAEGSLDQCSLFQVSGQRASSSCSDGQCYLAAVIGGASFWVADHAVGEAASYFGLPGDAACPELEVHDVSAVPSEGSGTNTMDEGTDFGSGDGYYGGGGYEVEGDSAETDRCE